MAKSLEEQLWAWRTDAVVREQLAGGARSDVWLIELDAERWTARRTRRTQQALEWELDLIQYLRAKGVGVPRVLPTIDGRRANGDLFVLSWIDGRSPVHKEEWQSVSDQLSRIHALTAGWPQRPTFASTQKLLSENQGGDVDLTLMPQDAVALCRTAWNGLANESVSAIHGDPLGNVLLTESGVVFIDWDEARVDASILDLADLPHADQRLDPDRLALARRGASAWEPAASWSLEPEYARRRLADV